ncbi:MAG: hypothetical protein FWB80_06620 [Defluviitaleaceae bacterium]|nr:hypothetical protein [Defluviitaleaceae bacterium]
MKASGRLSNKEYEDLSIEYEKNPPRLSGKPGFLSHMREKKLVNELMSPEYARIINVKAKAMLLSPAEVIRYAIKKQLLESDMVTK